MIGNYFLQSGNDIIDRLSSVVQLPEVQAYSSIIFPVIGLIFALVFGFIALRIFKNFIDYAGGGRKLGKFVIDVQGEYRFKGNVSERVDMFGEDVIEELKKVENDDIKKWAEEINHYIMNKEIFVYDVKFTDRDEAVNLRTDNDGVLISPVPIDDRRYCYFDKKGERSITSLINKEYSRVLLCHYKTKLIEDMPIPDEGKKDVWVLAPIPMTDIDQVDEVTFNPTSFISSEKIELVVKVLPQMESIAKALLHMEVLYNLHRQLRFKNITIGELIKQVERKDLLAIKKQRKEDYYRYELTEQPLIGDVHPPRQPPRDTSEVIWYAMFTIAGVAGWEMPHQIEQLSFIPPAFGVIIAFISLYTLRYYSKKSEAESYEVQKEV